jgi:hypothetical protein
MAANELSTKHFNSAGLLRPTTSTFVALPSAVMHYLTSFL